MTVRKISVDDGTHRPRASTEGSPFEEVFFDSFQGAVIEYRGPRFPAMETRPVVGSWKGTQTTKSDISSGRRCRQHIIEGVKYSFEDFTKGMINRSSEIDQLYLPGLSN